MIRRSRRDKSLGVPEGNGSLLSCLKVVLQVTGSVGKWLKEGRGD